MTGVLYVVATPIGNLEDITLRAINTLKSVDIIACEDTRRTGILTQKYGIHTKLESYYSYNQIRKTGYLITKLKEGKNIALVSDAGTPGISDPGYVMIKAAIENGISVVSIPGPSGLIGALVVSGKPTHKFIFEGFLSNKTSQRRKQLNMFKGEERTVILYESPHRILKLLKDIIEVLGNRDIVCVRELTKAFEEINRGKAAEIYDIYSKKAPKGEFIVIL